MGVVEVSDDRAVSGDLEGVCERVLYDAGADQVETTGLQEAKPPIYQYFARTLSEWTANVPGYAQDALSDEVEQRLSSLGHFG